MRIKNVGGAWAMMAGLIGRRGHAGPPGQAPRRSASFDNRMAMTETHLRRRVLTTAGRYPCTDPS
ncbi:hypothetical protein GCM10007320_15010 [Pseudorhodoferax aquiterrae]|uniref:Uncharacterized protein n=1 Tax=Pseudorhodoferax aquiterrae TaxID=747304 RepID=A0ABQ3FYS3_9BURK|nr:hypothetical protein GCM10007320_15010 [Pseudorhodoferax aquiterrae]